MKRLRKVVLLLAIYGCNTGDSIPYGYNVNTGSYFVADSSTSLYYEIYGEGEALILLHGGVFGYIDEFENLIPQLTSLYQVICLGTRGHVKSDIGKSPLSYSQRANDILMLLKHLNLETVTIVGFSDGGLSAYKFAALYPDMVQKMVVIGAGDDPVSELSSNDPSTYSVEYLLDLDSAYFDNRRAYMPEPERWNESLMMLNDLYNSDGISVETFERIDCPVLIMSGDKDDFATPEAAEVAHQHIANSQLSIIPGCGHVILYCNFPAVWASMQLFLGFEPESFSDLE